MMEELMSDPARSLSQTPTSDKLIRAALAVPVEKVRERERAEGIDRPPRRKLPKAKAKPRKK